MDEFEFMQNFITDYGVSCPWASEKSMNNLVTIIKWIFFSFTGNKDTYKVSNRFEKRTDQTSDGGVS